MEMEVRWVAGVGNCHVSLPLSLLQTLESTLPGQRLPPFLPLQLLSLSSDDVICYVSWSGSASSSAALEIAQELAACIGLSDGTVVRVRALPNVPKASFVTIEPATEDDWEVVELNAHVAEDAILNQVRIIHGKMTFPLWLHGNRIVTFTVVSMVPDKTAVQLVPGTEVAVAPKRRKKSADHCNDSSVKPLNGAHSFQKVLLRVQDPHTSLIQESDVGGETVGIELTSIALVHPDTAREYLLDSLQVIVVVPRLLPKLTETSGNTTLRNQSFSSAKELTDNVSTNKERDYPYAIVRLVLSESTAKGHLMLCRSLRRYLRVSFHSWVYVQRYSDNRKNDASSYYLSPCQFRILHKSKDPGNSTTDVLDDSIDKSSVARSNHDMGEAFMSLREKLASSLVHGTADTADKEIGIPTNIKDRLKGLIHTWMMTQSRAITSMTGVKPTSLVFGPTTFLSFKLMASGWASDGKSTTITETLGDARLTAESVDEILYMLTASGESLLGQKYCAYELTIVESRSTGVHDDLKLFCEHLNLGTYVSYGTCNDHVYNQTCASTASSLSWMGTAVTDVITRLTSLLSPDCGTLPLPGHVLIYGPPGSGKTSLSSAASKSLEGNKDILAHTVFVSCSAFSMEKASIRQMLCDHVSEALDNAPSLIVLDDLDSIVTSGGDTEGSQMSASVVALAKFIADIIDEYGEKRKKSCGLGPIAFIACVRAHDSIPESLTASGRFNFHIQLPAPSTPERLAILRHEIQKHSLQCSDDVLLDFASKCDGYDAYDLAILVGRTIHAAISRYLPPHKAEDGKRHSIIADDFLQARQDFLPASVRDITKAAPEDGRIGWEDVGGLIDVRNAIKEMIELPSKFPNIFAKSPLRLRSNVLLYGPPGCGKTHIVGAAAAASSLRFISIKGPELLNKYIGASEQAVRDVFSKSAAAAPCILFFDEFDSIAPKRGHDNTGVTDRVVNQFLTELDGVEVLTGVFVFAATSRPDLLDAALLRPGRLDRLLFCDFPDRHDRLDILRVLSKKLPLTDDVDLEAIALRTDGFSGADLQALLSDAQLAAAQELLDSGYDGKERTAPVITGELLNSVASKAKPSVAKSEQQRLYAIYNQFVDLKRSVAAQSRDAKGKRATLA